jgi:type IV pilus assembly protein PilV
MRPQKETLRGFTIVELMMALAVLAVGVSGIVAMQKVTAMTNLHSKSVATATRIAQAWEHQLVVDGSVWRQGLATGINTTTWLRNVSTQPVWFRPAYDNNRVFGAAFDALGNPVVEANIAQAQFCVHLQLIPVVALTVRNNATIRATVRVLWPRTESDPPPNFCSPDANVNTIGNDTTSFHSIYQTIAIRVHQ